MKRLRLTSPDYIALALESEKSPDYTTMTPVFIDLLMSNGMWHYAAIRCWAQEDAEYLLSLDAQAEAFYGS